MSPLQQIASGPLQSVRQNTLGGLHSVFKALELFRFHSLQFERLAAQVMQPSLIATASKNVAPSPKLLAEIGPWMRRMKSLKQDAAFAVLAASLSPQAQAAFNRSMLVATLNQAGGV